MTVYARLVNNEIEGVYDLLPTNWGDILNFDVKCKFEEEVMTQAGFVRIRRDYTTSSEPVNRSIYANSQLSISQTN